jgi:hypothetical protein
MTTFEEHFMTLDKRTLFEREKTERIKAMAQIISTAPLHTHRDWAMTQLVKIADEQYQGDLATLNIK